MDGIVYGAAAGLGYATLLNLTYVISNGGVDLGMGAIRIAVTALAHASFAGVTGYFLGRAKFENREPLWLPLGVLIAAVLNGIVSTALGEISRSGLRVTPLNGLILAAAVAAITFIVLFVIIQRNNRATTPPPPGVMPVAVLREGEHSMSTLDTTVNTVKRRLLRAEEPEWIVWLMIIAMLAIGLLTHGLVESRTDRFNADNITLRYPAAWSNLGIDSPYAGAERRRGPGGRPVPHPVRVLKMPVTDLSTSAQTLGDLALKWSDKQVEELVAYRVLSVRAATDRQTGCHQGCLRLRRRPDPRDLQQRARRGAGRGCIDPPGQRCSHCLLCG